jgi:hypothetical protein
VSTDFVITTVWETCAAAFDLDAEDNAHFFLIEGSDSAGTATGHYLTNASGDWVKTPVDEEAGRIRSVSLEVDDDGFVHVAYDKITGSTVRYATNSSGAWVVSIVDSAPLGGASSRLALDTSGVPHVAYGGGSDFRIATPAETDWNTPVIAGESAHGISFWIDDDGTRHAAFGDYDQTGIKVYSEGDESWSSTEVTEGQTSSLFRAPDGSLRLSYLVPKTSSTPTELLHRVETGPGEWSQPQLIDQTALFGISQPDSVPRGDSFSIAYALSNSIGAGCNIHVADYNTTRSEFSVRRVSRSGNSPYVRVDSSGKLQIAFCNSAELQLATEQ